VYQNTFLINCPICKARVGAIEKGSASETYYGEDFDYSGIKLAIGLCPSCRRLLVGKAEQVGLEGVDSDTDEWSRIFTRIYPNPQKTFQSVRIPIPALEALSDADLSLQANANKAACVMLGTALEAICKDALGTKTTLAKGIDALRERGIIDNRLYEWSQQLRAFRNLAAHADEDRSSISMQDAEDLQSFVYAIFEYIYDLTDRYEEFKARTAKR
jgi:hypothetical protein